MEVEIIEEEKNKIKILFKDKDLHTIPAIICHELNKDPDVIFASYRIEHPLKENVEIVVKTKNKDPKQVISEAIKRLEEKIKEFLEAWSKRE